VSIALRHRFPRRFPLTGTKYYASGFAYLPTTYRYGHPIVRTLNLLRHPIPIVLGGAGIFNLLSIAYAFLPWLRGRLTQGRRALPWNPWAYGEEDSHFLYRLLMPWIFTSIRSSAPYGTPSTQILRSPTAHIGNLYAPVISVLCLVP
jgi:hypothetical protein